MDHPTSLKSSFVWRKLEMNLRRRKVSLGLLLLGAVLLMLGCGGGTTASYARRGPVKMSSRWVILPVANNSETPLAGERVEAMLDTVLRKGGVAQLDRYPPAKEDDTHLVTSDRQRYEAAFEWARNAKYDYAVAGSVEEWRYKSGLDGEPAIGLSLRVVEVATGRVLWAGTGTKTGGANENTSATALKLLDMMVQELNSSP